MKKLGHALSLLIVGGADGADPVDPPPDINATEIIAKASLLISSRSWGALASKIDCRSR